MSDPRQDGHDLGGSVNLNLLVSRGGEQLVARVHRPSVAPARLADIQAIRDRPHAAGVPCQALVPARDGARWAPAAGRLVEVERFSNAGVGRGVGCSYGGDSD